MIGAAFIMADPIFQGLAISLVFGLASSTALTVNVQASPPRHEAKLRSAFAFPYFNKLTVPPTQRGRSVRGLRQHWHGHREESLRFREYRSRNWSLPGSRRRSLRRTRQAIGDDRLFDSIAPDREA